MKTFIIITRSLKYNAVIQDEWKMPLSDHSLFHIILASVWREKESHKNLRIISVTAKTRTRHTSTAITSGTV
jgi:hypothetical protein